MISEFQVCFFDHSFCGGIWVGMMFTIECFDRISITKQGNFHKEFGICFVITQKSSYQKKIDILFLIEFIWTDFSFGIVCLSDKIWMPSNFRIWHFTIIGVFHICSLIYFIRRKMIGPSICRYACSSFFVVSIQNLKRSCRGRIFIIDILSVATLNMQHIFHKIYNILLYDTPLR